MTKTSTSPAPPRRPKPPAPSRLLLLDPTPCIDAGRFAPKRTVGESVTAGVTIVADGHDVVRGVLRVRAPGGRRFTELPLAPVDAHLGGDRWEATFGVDRMGRWAWTVEAWVDGFASWRHELARKVAAAQPDLSGERSEGVVLLRDAAARATGHDRRLILTAITTLEDAGTPTEIKHDVALGDELAAAVARNPDRAGAATLAEPLEVDVDRERARFGSWYELFPRSWGGLAGVRDIVPRLAELGFDVLYLPPVHPIGVTNRKGPNNALVAGPGDPGSPWAIGLHGVGGHEALHPDLGDLDDFAALAEACRAHGIDLCIDLAIQASADHPWLTEHPEWFHRRPDGSLKYAENPPKKYQDIYNVNFSSEDWKGLWNALLEITLTWVARGVTVFRVDNPHTKPTAFWEWLIREVRRRHPEVVFLAEAFTRREIMRTLAKAGFSQSYTYFTWKTSRHELTEYVTELAEESADYFRPNFFVNTPDILHASLQHGGPPAFEARLVLAGTLSPSYGIYSGFESFENVAVAAGSEEYLDSEKYETKQRTLDGPLLPMIRMLNEARRANPALQHLSNITFLETANDALIAYHKRTGSNAVICVVCLDPHHVQEGLIDIRGDLGLDPDFQVQDLLDGARYAWSLGSNYVRLGPGGRQAHLFRVVGW